jgi:hypothetical protein
MMIDGLTPRQREARPLSLIRPSAAPGWLVPGRGRHELSYHLDVPSGTTIVLTGAVLFAAVLAFTGGRRLQRTARLDAHSQAA